MQNLRMAYDDGGYFFTGVIIKMSRNDDTRALMRVDPEYADRDGGDLFWINTENAYPESELEPEEF
jgi:hypothetical protein